MATPDQYGTYSNAYGFSLIVNGPPNAKGTYQSTRDGRISNEYRPEELADLINVKGWKFEPLNPNPAVQTTPEMGNMGGRRRGTKKTRKGNKMLSSWVAFVKKVQHEEKISYSDAMKRASARKKEWKMGQMGGADDSVPDPDPDPDSINNFSSSDDELDGGRRRRRTRKSGSKRRGTKKRRGSRRR